MREIRFRQPIYVNGKFSSWHKWGFWDGNFYGPYVSGETTVEKAEKESQQFTGLHDKQGDPIFKGDIYKEGKRLWVVVFTDGCFMGDFNNGQSQRFIANEGIEIVGNVHED